MVLVLAKERVKFLTVPMRGCNLETCRHPGVVVLYHSYHHGGAGVRDSHFFEEGACGFGWKNKAPREGLLPFCSFFAGSKH